MRIGIDARLWAQTGIGRYIRNICIGLHQIDSKNTYVLIIRSDDLVDVRKHIHKKNWEITQTNLKWHSLREQLSFPKLLKKLNLDLVHFPYFDIPFFYRDPYVITIHDLIYHHFITGKASTNPFWLYGFKILGYKIVINNASRKAKKIIAVSNSTKNEIFDHLLVNKNKVEVIYEASDDFKLNDSGNPGLGKYFLYVGNVYPHKNVENMLNAFKFISEKNKVKLVFIGSDDYFYSRLRKDLSKLIKSGSIIVKENISDKQLANYYSHAVCLVRPSLMEGFSLPPLEAMTSECLVIGSEIPVHREIFKDVMIYFCP